MKTFTYLKTGAFVFVTAVLFISCQSLYEQGFNHQRYTHYKVKHHEVKNEAEQLAYDNKNKENIIPQPDSKELASVKSENMDLPVHNNFVPVKDKNIQVNSPAGHETGNSPTVQLKKKKNAVSLLMKARQNKPKDSDGQMILLVLLCIFLPPLAVYLKDHETNKWFWITFILCLLTFTYFFFVGGGAFWFIAMIIALLDVFDAI